MINLIKMENSFCAEIHKCDKTKKKFFRQIDRWKRIRNWKGFWSLYFKFSFQGGRMAWNVREFRKGFELKGTSQTYAHRGYRGKLSLWKFFSLTLGEIKKQKHIWNFSRVLTFYHSHLGKQIWWSRPCIHKVSDYYRNRLYSKNPAPFPPNLCFKMETSWKEVC